MKRFFLWQPLNWRWLNNSENEKWTRIIHGFSLIEMLIVVAIITVLTTLVTINFSFLNAIFIKSEIQKLHMVCHYLRRKAMMSNQIQKLTFDIHNNTYRYDAYTEKFAQSVCFGVLPETKGPPSKPLHYIQEPISFKNNEIVFFPDGIVSSGTIYLTDITKHYQYALSVSVGHISYMRLYQYDKNWKLVS